MASNEENVCILMTSSCILAYDKTMFLCISSWYSTASYWFYCHGFVRNSITSNKDTNALSINEITMRNISKQSIAGRQEIICTHNKSNATKPCMINGTHCVRFVKHLSMIINLESAHSHNRQSRYTPNFLARTIHPYTNTIATPWMYVNGIPSSFNESISLSDNYPS